MYVHNYHIYEEITEGARLYLIKDLLIHAHYYNETS